LAVHLDLVDKAGDVRIKLDGVFRDVPTWKILEIVKTRIVNDFLKTLACQAMVGG